MNQSSFLTSRNESIRNTRTCRRWRKNKKEGKKGTNHLENGFDFAELGGELDDDAVFLLDLVLSLGDLALKRLMFFHYFDSS